MTIISDIILRAYRSTAHEGSSLIRCNHPNNLNKSHSLELLKIIERSDFCREEKWIFCNYYPLCPNAIHFNQSYIEWISIISKVQTTVSVSLSTLKKIIILNKMESCLPWEILILSSIGWCDLFEEILLESASGYHYFVIQCKVHRHGYFFF